MAEKLNLTDKLAQFFKEKRLSMGMTQKGFAYHIFGDVKYHKWISVIENGRPITVTTLSKMLEKLNCEINIIEY